MSFEVSGIEAVNRRLEQLAVAPEGAGVDAARASALHLLGEAAMLAPVDTGDLRGSGNVAELPDGAAVRFQTRYAAVQHERLDFNHPRGGQAKYLEAPLIQNRDRYLRHILDAIRRDIR
jgi:hypothetical protein